MTRVILGNIAISQTGPFGSQLHEEDYVSEGTPIVTVEHLGDTNFTHQNLPFVSEADTKRLSKYILIEGDIVFSRVGSIDRNVYVDKNHEGWMFSGRCIRVRADKNKVNPRYLSYYFKQNSFKKMMMNLAVGATMPSLNTKIMNSIELDLLPRENQDKIANILSAIDDKIQINNQINQELETIAKTLYDYWFVQFDFPDQNGKPYKSSGGKMVYHPELKREIPEGWGMTTFSSWISDNKTGDWGKETSQGNYTLEVDCIRGADINGLSGNGKTDMPTRFILEKNKNKLLTDFDIVIEISGGSPTQSTGRIVGISENVLNRFDLPLICSNFCKAVSLNEQETFYNFVYEWKNLYDNGVLFSWEGKTSGIKNLLFDSFVANYHIAQPPIDLMKQFFDFASSVDKKTQLLLKQNQELTQLRDWLLPMLMNGQVKVE